MTTVSRLPVTRTLELSNGIDLLEIVWNSSFVWRIRSIFVDQPHGPILLIGCPIRCSFITIAIRLKRLAGVYQLPATRLGIFSNGLSCAPRYLNKNG